MQGSTIATSVTTLILGWAILFTSNQDARGYDRPDFEVSIFDRDGLSLSQEASDGIVDNLVTIANDPDSDSDLREKAIGLALRVDPMHVAARKANVSFSNGKLPPAGTLADKFQFAENADKLWESGLELILKKPSPADAELAPYLMEIALTAHPRPAGEKVWRLAEVTNYKSQRWERFTKLQPNENPSGTKMGALFEIAKREPIPRKRNPKNEADPFMEEAAVTPVPEPLPGPVPDFPGMEEAAPAEIQVESGKMSTLVSTKDGLIPAFLHLDIREPTEDEGSLFSLFAPSGERRDTFEMKVRTTISRIELEGIDETETLIRGAYPRWPDKKIAEFSLRDIDGEQLDLPEGERETADVGFPSGILFFQAFSGNVPRPDFIFVGKELQKSSSKTKITDVATALKKMSVPNALVRMDSYPAMLEEAIVNDEISALFHIQFIGIQNIPEAVQVILEKSELPVVDAVEAFGKFVDAKPAQLSPVDFIKSSTGKAQLSSLVERFPFHLSAKILHEIGSKPPETELLTKRFVTQIDNLMKPFIKYYNKSGGEGGVVSQNLESRFDDATSTIRRMRDDGLPREVFGYQALSEEALDFLEKYLGIKNKDTRMGQQSHRELREAIQKLSAEREKLGFGPFELDQ